MINTNKTGGRAMTEISKKIGYEVKIVKEEK